MEAVGKVLVIAAAVLALVGGTLLLAAKLGIERLPGDLRLERDGFTLYLPVGLMILVSVIGTVVLNLLRK